MIATVVRILLLFERYRCLQNEFTCTCVSLFTAFFYRHLELMREAISQALPLWKCVHLPTFFMEARNYCLIFLHIKSRQGQYSASRFSSSTHSASPLIQLKLLMIIIATLYVIIIIINVNMIEEKVDWNRLNNNIDIIMTFKYIIVKTVIYKKKSDIS